MKKFVKLLSLTMAVALIALFSLVPVSAANTQPFTAADDAGATGNGGLWVKTATATLTAAGDVLSMTGAAPADRGLWVWPDAVAATYPYLVYEVTANDGGSLRLSNNVATTDDEVALDITPGQHCVLAADVVKDYATVGYLYLLAYPDVGTGISFKAYLSDTEVGAEPQGGDEPQTGVEAPIALVSLVTLAAAGMAIASRRK